MKTIIPLLFFLFLSCQKEKPTEPVEASESTAAIPKVNDEFQVFLDKFPEVELPITIEGCSYNTSKLKQLEIGKYAVGKFRTNGNYIATISLSAADCFLPILTTYKLTGEKIDSKEIAIGYCDDGPCYECNEYMLLMRDGKIYTCDTMKTYDCDDDYNEIKGTERIKVVYKQGNLTGKGKIELSGELKKEL